MAGLEHAEQAVVAGHRGRDDRVEVHVADAGVALRVVPEPGVLHVVPGRDGAALVDREAGEAGGPRVGAPAG